MKSYLVLVFMLMNIQGNSVCAAPIDGQDSLVLSTPSPPLIMSMYFGYKQSKLSAEDKMILEQLVKKHRKESADDKSSVRYIVVYGRVDAMEAEVGNQRVSAQRAAVVVDFLLKNGISSNNIRMVDEKSSAAKADDECQKQSTALKLSAKKQKEARILCNAQDREAYMLLWRYPPIEFRKPWTPPKL